MNKIIHVKCTYEEMERIKKELTAYLYDYQFNFLVQDENPANIKERKE